MAEEVTKPSSFAWSPDSGRVLLAQRKEVSVVPVPSSDTAHIKCQTQKGLSYWDLPIWSPDGKLIAACGSRQPDTSWHTDIRIWNSETGNLVNSLDAKQTIETMSWTPDGKQFVYSEPGMLHVLASDTMKEIHAEKTDDVQAIRFRFSPNGKQLVYKDCQFIYIRDLNTLHQVMKIEAAKSGFFGFELSQDGNYVLIENAGTVAICDTRTGYYLGHEKFPDTTSADWEPSGKSIVLWRNSLPPRFVAVNLAARNSETSVFEGGKIGSPGWENQPSPKSLEECYENFDKHLSPQQIKRFKDTKENRLSEFGGRSWISDSMMADVYDKWGSNDLRKWFQTRGIFDPRDVTDIMLVSYSRHLNSKPIELDAQIYRHRAWWNREGPAIVHENRQLSEQLMTAAMKTQNGHLLTIGNLPGRIKVVCFADTECKPTADLLKGLRDLRQKYDPTSVSMSVVVLDCKALDIHKTKVSDGVFDSPGEIASVLKDPNSGLLVVYGSRTVWNDLRSFTHRQMRWLPQTFIMAENGLVVTSLNGAALGDDDFVEHLNEQISLALDRSHE